MFDETLYAMKSVLDPQIGLVLAMDGRFDEQLLSRAIRISLDTEPHLGCRFVPGWWRACWERKENLREDTYFKVQSTADPSRDLVDFLAEPINSFEGPQVNALLLRSDIDTLCLKVSHFAADAWGVKQYSYLLANIYGSLTTTPDFTPEPNLTGSRSMRQISSHFSLADHVRIMRRGFRDIKDNFMSGTPCTFPAKKAEPSSRTYVIRKIGPEKYQKIVHSIKPLSATINDYLMAALFRALYNTHNSKNDSALGLVVTADLRRYLPDNWQSALCNLSGWVFPNIGKNPGKSMQDTCRLVTKTMNKLKADYIGLGSFPMLALGNKSLPLSWAKKIFERVMTPAFSQGKIAPSLTNMGLINDKKLDFGNIQVKEAFLLPPIVMPAYWAAGLSGFKNSLTLSSGFCASSIETDHVERFFDLVFKEMPE
jgi:NRPS condensation-like uncharacterized protein